MNAGNYEIRKGRTADVFAIGRLLVETWRASFRGLIADSFLDAMSPAEQAVRHMGRRSAGGVQYLVATEPDAGKIVGFANFGPARGVAAAGIGEIYALYILPDYQRRGIGAALVRGAARAMQADGAVSLSIWVLSANPNRAFYERLGGEYARAGSVSVGGVNHRQVAYLWEDIGRLAG
jgi:GNAT superfamily N-acetyltransferase